MGKRTKKANTKEGQVIMVVGLGTFGRRVSTVLVQKGAEVIAVDSQPARIEGIKDDVAQAVVMDATEEDRFAQIALEDVSSAVVAIGDNIEGSILTTALLHQRGVPRIYARAVTQIHRQVLRQVGADVIINIEENEGEELARRLAAPQILESTALSADISLAEVICPAPFHGKSLEEIDLRRRLNINVAAIKRNKITVDESGNSQNTEDILFPEGNLPLSPEDTLVVVGHNRDIENLKEV